MTELRLISTVLGAPQPGVLAEFYRRLLGGDVSHEDETFSKLRWADGRAGLSFQMEPEFTAPVWPEPGDGQRMTMHLDIQVDDVDAAVAHAIAVGATKHQVQPEPTDFIVMVDPVGHLFCLFER